MTSEDASEKFARARLLSKDPERCREAIALYEAAAADGLAEAQTNLAALFESGDCGLPKDLSRAFELYTAAARQGISAAQYNLARFYHFGQGPERDPAKAVELYELAAEQGNADAMANLGAMAARGEMDSPDASRAMHWYARAAELGHPLGMRAMGLAHLTGEGSLPIDNEAAANWLRKAAEHGDDYSWYQLGRLLWRGKGVRRNRVLSLRLAARAARSEEGWRGIVSTLSPSLARLLNFIRVSG